MPEAMAANANLFVSAENSQFNNRISGPQVVEVVIIDSDINEVGTVYGEPDVTVNSKKLRMAQATDGNWYGYFAEVDQAQYADYTQVGGGKGTGLDFGTFCRADDGTQILGFSVSETKGIAVNSDIGVNGTATSVNPVTNDCNAALATSTNNTINVVREPKALNVNTAVSTGQIGFNTTLYPRTDANAVNQFGTGEVIGSANNSVWPFIQLYDFSVGGSVQVSYNKAGGQQTVSFAFDEADDITTTLDRTVYPQSAHVQADIADFWLNMDPTDEDSWTFGTTSGSERVYYQMFDESGTAQSGVEIDISASLEKLLNSDGKLMINGAANGQTNVITLSTNDNGATSSDLITFLESGVNTGVFTSYDSDDDSVIRITDTAARGTTATISYDDSPMSILVGHSFGEIKMEIADDTWNSGETLTVTLIDNDLNKNSLSDEDLDVEVVGNTLIPSLVTGDPFTLGEKATTLDVAYLNSTAVANLSNNVADLSWSNDGNGTGTVTVYSFSEIGKAILTEADTTADATNTDQFSGFVVDLGATMADLKESINTSTSFRGFNLLSYNLQSFNTTGTVDIFLVNSTLDVVNSSGCITCGGSAETSNLIELVDDGNMKGLVDIADAETAINTSVTNLDSAQNIGLYIHMNVSGQAMSLTDSDAAASTRTSDSFYVDFLTFGFTNSGEDASERTSTIRTNG
jgi:hypothetical protein